VSEALVWRRPPLALAAEAAAWEALLRRLVMAALENIAARMEAHMKATAPWQDRTGAARASLHAEAGQPGPDAWEILFGFGAWIAYGIYLEEGTRTMEAYPVLGPTRDLFAVEIMRALALLVG